MRRRVALFLAASTLTLGVAHAADPLAVGVLLPGSRSDKGWMESGYDGLTAVQKALGSKIDRQRRITWRDCRTHPARRAVGLLQAHAQAG